MDPTLNSNPDDSYMSRTSFRRQTWSREELFMNVSHNTVNKKYKHSCTTVSGPHTGSPCKFPFVYPDCSVSIYYLNPYNQLLQLFTASASQAISLSVKMVYLQNSMINVALIFLENGVLPEHISMILLLLESGDIVILAAAVKYILILQALKIMTCGVKTFSEFKFTLVATVTHITQQIHLSLEIEDHSMQN